MSTCVNLSGSGVGYSLNLDPRISPHLEAEHPLVINRTALPLFRSTPFPFKTVSLFHSLHRLRWSPPFPSSQFRSMANPTIATLSFLLLFLLSLSPNTTASADSPDNSPAPAPHSPSSSPSPSPAPNPAPATSPQGPSPTPTPPVDSHSAPSPGSSPSPSPSPSPAEADDDGVGLTRVANKDGESSGGSKAAKKAGIAIGVIVAAGVIVFGALVYRKRRQNIQRSQFGYAARTELL